MSICVFKLVIYWAGPPNYSGRERPGGEVKCSNEEGKLHYFKYLVEDNKEEDKPVNGGN